LKDAVDFIKETKKNETLALSNAHKDFLDEQREE